MAYDAVFLVYPYATQVVLFVRRNERIPDSLLVDVGVQRHFRKPVFKRHRRIRRRGRSPPRRKIEIDKNSDQEHSNHDSDQQSLEHVPFSPLVWFFLSLTQLDRSRNSLRTPALSSHLKMSTVK